LPSLSPIHRIRSARRDTEQALVIDRHCDVGSKGDLIYIADPGGGTGDEAI
jgi:hypothetical protein